MRSCCRGSSQIADKLRDGDVLGATQHGDDVLVMGVLGIRRPAFEW
ncbi:hypothetical protein [Rathayibacter toxicus]|nr:hypothetical protein [Rathayibacter toxicus]